MVLVRMQVVPLRRRHARCVSDAFGVNTVAQRMAFLRSYLRKIGEGNDNSLSLLTAPGTSLSSLCALHPFIPHSDSCGRCCNLPSPLSKGETEAG